MGLFNKKPAEAPAGGAKAKLTSVPPPQAAVYTAFVAQGAWKTWVIAALLGLLGLSLVLNVRLATKAPEYVLVDATTGDATLVKRSVATEALLSFIADKTRPPEPAIVRFTQEFLQLALGVNSSTIEANWEEALTRMTPTLRQRLEAEAKAQKVIETYKASGRKTDLKFTDIRLLDRTSKLLAVRATIQRRVAPLLETGNGPSAEDRIQVDTVLEIVAPTTDSPAGLKVAEFRLAKVENTPDVGADAPTGK